MTTATRIDIHTLNTAATRALAESGPALQKVMDEREQEARNGGNAMTIAELSTYLPADAKHANKAAWVEAYVQHEVASTAAFTTYNSLRREASRDEMLARRINHLMDASDQADMLMKSIATEYSGRGMRHKLSWSLDEVMVAQEAGYTAREIVRGVNDHQGDLREIAIHFLKEAIQTVMGFPSAARSNGMGSVLRMDNLVGAQAAKVYIDAVLLELDGETSIPLKWLRAY